MRMRARDKRRATPGSPHATGPARRLQLQRQSCLESAPARFPRGSQSLAPAPGRVQHRYPATGVHSARRTIMLQASVRLAAASWGLIGPRVRCNRLGTRKIRTANRIPVCTRHGPEETGADVCTKAIIGDRATNAGAASGSCGSLGSAGFGVPQVEMR